MRLFTVICIAALAVVLAMPVYAEVQNVKVGGDILIRGVHRDDYDFRNDNKDSAALNAATQDRSSLYNTVTRVNVNADLTDNVATAVRLVNERDWDMDAAAANDIDIDIASVTLKELVHSPLTLTLGRQEIKLGNGLVIADVNRPNYAPAIRGTMDLGTNTAAGTAGWTGPNGTLTAGYGDLTLRKAFDAIRATLDYDKWSVDGVIIKVNETAATTNDDDLYGVNVSYKFNNKYNAAVEGYLLYDTDESFNRTITSTEANDTRRIYEKSKLYVLGANGTIDPIENLNLKGEAAYQFGEIRDDALNTGATADSVLDSSITDRNRRAWAFDAAGSYKWVNAKWAPALGLSYTYRSGEEAGSGGDYEVWEPLFTDQVRGEIAKVTLNGPNAGNTSNASIFGVNGSIKPIEKLLVSLDYYHSLLAEKLLETTIDTDLVTNRKAKKDLADELDLNLTYSYTEDVSFGLLGAVLFPSNSFSNSYDDTAFETVGSVKVTF